MQKICLIIPCYNEAARLNVTALTHFIKEHPDIDLFLVDDGSKDKTSSILQDIRQEAGRQVHIRVLNGNKGKAEAIRTIIIQLQPHAYAYIGFFDADLATPLDQINEFLKIFQLFPSCQLVMGSRIQRLGSDIQRNFFRHIIGRVFATMASRMLHVRVYDTQCGAKIFKSDFAKNIFKVPFISRWLFDIEILFRIIHSHGIEETNKIIYELPLTKWKDVHGSQLRPIHFIRLPFELIKIYLKYR